MHPTGTYGAMARSKDLSFRGAQSRSSLFRSCLSRLVLFRSGSSLVAGAAMCLFVPHLLLVSPAQADGRSDSRVKVQTKANTNVEANAEAKKARLELNQAKKDMTFAERLVRTGEIEPGL